MKWLDEVRAAIAEGFEDLARDDDLPGQALADSMYWARTVFAKGAGPYEQALSAPRGVHRASQSAPDLLRHAYTSAGVGLIVIEGRSFLLVLVSRDDLDILALHEEEKRAAVARIAGSLFHPTCSRGGLCFRFPERIEEGAIFSTNPDMDPRISAAWSDRIDAGVRDGALFFLLYKRLPWMMGFRDAFSWLRDEARAWPRRRRRARRRR